MASSDNSDWAGYARSFLITLGMLFVGLPCWVWHKQGERASEWTTFGWFLFWGVGVLGLLLLAIAILASTRTVERWADAASTHEASNLVMIIAAPVYFVFKWLTRKR